jgi:flagellar biosynthesis/type III secretory pathway chaperone
MDQPACLSQLSRLLADETTLLGTLEQQLQHEYTLLEANDIENLDQASHVRQRSVADLLRIDDDRRGLCRMLGQSPDQTGLAALLTWCDPEGSLATGLADCAAQAQRCRDQNDRNGALVTARLRRVSGMLGMLNANTSPKTYESRGQGSTSTMPAGRMVSVSA